MSFFSKKPIRRLLFVPIYVVFAICILAEDIAFLNILCSIFILFVGYIAIVKSGILKDENAQKIDDWRFDFFSIAVAVFLLLTAILSYK